MAGIYIDEDELEQQVYQFLRDKMVQAASVAIQRQAKDIVAGELARLRLTDPSSRTLGDMVSDALASLIDSRLQAILGPMVKEQLRLIMNQATSPK